MNWFLLALKNTFNFKGRARRREFGWYHLTILIIGFSVSFIAESAMTLNLTGFANALSGGYEVISYALTVTAVSLSMRRLHDLGYSGWWLLSLYIPLGYIYLRVYQLTGSIGEKMITQVLYYDMILQAVAFVFMVIALIMLLVLLFKDGQKHANKYGESPKYPNNAVPESQEGDLAA